MVTNVQRDNPVDENEIVVTKEMIEAGVLAFYEWDLSVGVIGEALPDVFRAMLAKMQ